MKILVQVRHSAKQNITQINFTSFIYNIYAIFDKYNIYIMTIRFTTFWKRIEFLNVLVSVYRQRIVVAATFQQPLIIYCARKLLITLNFSLMSDSYKIVLLISILICRYSIFATSNSIQQRQHYQLFHQLNQLSSPSN